MKTIRHFFAFALSAFVLFTGCKYDDDKVWEELDKQAERIAALEQWKETVNGNITTLQGLVSALENKDYVTGVTAFDTPAPGGYRITFTKSPEATIWNGAKGDKGDKGSTGHSPDIAVKQDTDGKYYWTLDGEWILDDSKNKVPVTGAQGEAGTNGATPKVAIGPDGLWYISADGTATETPPGTGWTNTGVKAIGQDGAQGPAGQDGDAIFSGAPVDKGDYWEFTLAGTTPTTIELPKYKAIGISFVQPGAFIAGQIYEVPYTITGTSTPTDIRVTNVPAGWAVSVNKGTSKFEITPPADFSGTSVEFGKATVYIDEGNKIAAMYNLELYNRRISDNTFNADYYENGVVTGKVYIINDGTPGSGRIYTPQYPLLMWDDGNYDVAAISRTDGLYNMKAVADFIENSNGTYNWSNFPVFEWIQSLNSGNTVYISGSVGIWYLPSLEELTKLKNITGAISQWTWSSTSESSTTAWCEINAVGPSNDPKSLSTWCRAICKF